MIERAAKRAARKISKTRDDVKMVTLLQEREIAYGGGEGRGGERREKNLVRRLFSQKTKEHKRGKNQTASEAPWSTRKWERR